MWSSSLVADSQCCHSSASTMGLQQLLSLHVLCRHLEDNGAKYTAVTTGHSEVDEGAEVWFASGTTLMPQATCSRWEALVGQWLSHIALPVFA